LQDKQKILANRNLLAASFTQHWFLPFLQWLAGMKFVTFHNYPEAKDMSDN